MPVVGRQVPEGFGCVREGMYYVTPAAACIIKLDSLQLQAESNVDKDRSLPLVESHLGAALSGSTLACKDQSSGR